MKRGSSKTGMVNRGRLKRSRLNKSRFKRHAKERKANICSARSTVIMDDVDILLSEISANRRVPGIGSPQRNCWLDEIKSLHKRIDQAREAGCHLDPSLKARLNQEKALLMEDENLAKMEL